jgi:prepilin-type processing-associated H-X9-DG protein
MAMMNYESKKKSFPGYANTVGVNPNPVSWVIVLFPYFEHKDLYDTWANPSTTGPLVTSIPMLVCASDSTSTGPGNAPLSYVCNRGVDGWDYQWLGVCTNQAKPVSTPALKTFPPVRVGVDYVSSHDGSSMTLLLAEAILVNPTDNPRLLYDRNPSAGEPAKWTAQLQPNATATTGLWGSPGAAAPNAMEKAVAFDWGKFADSLPTPLTASVNDKILSAHRDGANVSFCDGHQAYLNDTIDVQVFKLLMTPWGKGIPRTHPDPSNAGNKICTKEPWFQDPPLATASIMDIPATDKLLDEGEY